MQHRAPPALAMRVDQVRNGCLDASLRQRGDYEIAFPGPVWRVRPMLGGAAAANPEMRAKRRNAVGRGRCDAHQMAPVRVAGDRLHLHGFARQRVRNENVAIRRLGEAVGPMSHARNDNPLGHTSLQVRSLPIF